MIKNHSCTADPKPQRTLLTPKPELPQHAKALFALAESVVVFFSGAVKNGSFMINDSKKRFPIMILALIFFSPLLWRIATIICGDHSFKPDMCKRRMVEGPFSKSARKWAFF